MTRERMKLLVAGDTLTWRIDRSRKLAVLRPPEEAGNHVVRVLVRWLPDGNASWLSSSHTAHESKLIDLYEIDKDFATEWQTHLVDYHHTDTTVAALIVPEGGADRCCSGCGMVIDGNGNGTQRGKL